MEFKAKVVADARSRRLVVPSTSSEVAGDKAADQEDEDDDEEKGGEVPTAITRRKCAHRIPRWQYDKQPIVPFKGFTLKIRKCKRRRTGSAGDLSFLAEEAPADEAQGLIGSHVSPGTSDKSDCALSLWTATISGDEWNSRYYHVTKMGSQD